MATLEDNFWGTRMAGFGVLSHNMKAGQLAYKELSEFLRARSVAEDAYAKSLVRLGKTVIFEDLGSFMPMWAQLQSTTEELGNIHAQFSNDLIDLSKLVKDAGNMQAEGQKWTKTCEVPELQQTFQVAFQNLDKSKKASARYHKEAEDLQNEFIRKTKEPGVNPRELDKAEKDLKKAQTKANEAQKESRVMSTRFEEAKERYWASMSDALKRFQELEETHLEKLRTLTLKFSANEVLVLADCSRIADECKRKWEGLTVEKLIAKFAQTRGTGTERPDGSGGEVPAEASGSGKSAAVDPSLKHSDSNHSINSLPEDNGEKRGRAHTFTGTLRLFKKKKDSKDGEAAGAATATATGAAPAGGQAAAKVDEEGFSEAPDLATEYRAGFAGTDKKASDSDSDQEEENTPKLRFVINQAPAVQQATVEDIAANLTDLKLALPDQPRARSRTFNGPTTRMRPRGMSEAPGTAAQIPETASGPGTPGERSLDTSGKSTSEVFQFPTSASTDSFGSGGTPRPQSPGGTLLAPPGVDSPRTRRGSSASSSLAPAFNASHRHSVIGIPASSGSSGAGSSSAFSSGFGNFSTFGTFGASAQSASADGFPAASSDAPVLKGQTSSGNLFDSPLTMSRRTSSVPVPTSSGFPSFHLVDAALTETVNAYFKGAKVAKYVVAGDILFNFPAAAAGVFERATSAGFRIVEGLSKLDSFQPNPQFIDAAQSKPDEGVYAFDLAAVAKHLHGASASTSRVDVLKYSMKPVHDPSVIPLRLCANYKADATSTDVVLHFQCSSSLEHPLTEVSATIGVDGAVVSCMANPNGAWNAEQKRLLWSVPSLSASNPPSGRGKFTAKFETTALTTPTTANLRFRCDKSTLSGLKIEVFCIVPNEESPLQLSRVIKRFSTGKYMADPE